MKSIGRRAQNKELQSHYVWIENKPESKRNQRRLLLKTARKNNVDTSEWEGASDHKDVIAAMRNMQKDF